MSKHDDRESDAATKVAEGIGDALGRLVNRLEGLDAERGRAYEQLLSLQKRLNEQVARFGRDLGAAAKKARNQVGAVERRGPTAKKARTPRSAKRGRVTCSVCGTPGHNARGHARWEAERAK